MDIERLKGLPILKAHFKKLANTSKAAYADLNLPDNTVGVVYWKEEDSWVVWNYWLEDSIRAIKSETKDRGYKIDALFFADKFEAKNYNGAIGKLLHVAVEAYANPENKTGANIEGIIVVELDFNDDPVYFLMEDNAFQDELTKDEFCELWEYKCEAISIPEGTTTIKDKSFADYTDLKSIVIPDSVTEIGKQAFKGCTGMTSIVIPDSVTEIGSSAFSGCTGLTSIVIGNSVTEIGDNAFMGCTGLTSIIVSEGNGKYDSRDNCNAIIETEENTLIAGCKSTVIPDSVTKIGNYAFRGCTGLTSTVIPDSVTEIGDCAFYDCTGLTNVVIPDSVTKIGDNAFMGCTGLTSIVIPNSVTSIRRCAFSGCTGLTSIVIPSSIKTIEWGGFNKCISLKSITIEGPVEKIEECAFDRCTSLKTLTLAAGIKKISKKAFEDCTAIERINVPAKKADYYKKRLPAELHSFITELPEEKKAKKK